MVEHVGAVSSEAAVSPLVKPEYEGVMAGGPFPYVTDADDAVMTSAAAPITTAPLA